MGDLSAISGNLLYAAFFLYLIATFFFGATIRDKKRTKVELRGISESPLQYWVFNPSRLLYNKVDCK